MLLDLAGNKIPTTDKKTVLCTVTFLYTMKGVINAKNPKKETVFAYIEEGSTNKDCVFLFDPAGVEKTNCVITEVLVFPIPTVTHED